MKGGICGHHEILAMLEVAGVPKGVGRMMMEEGIGVDILRGGREESWQRWLVRGEGVWGVLVNMQPINCCSSPV